MEVRVIFSL